MKHYALHTSGKKKWIALVLAIALGYWAWHSFSGKGEREKQAQAVPVQVAVVAKQDIPVYLDGLGTIEASQNVTVRTQVDGQMVKVLFREGQEVREGDVLAQIDPRTYQAQLNQALATKAKDEAQLANARRDVERYERLGEAIAAQTLDTQRATARQLEAAVQADQAAVENAKALLSYTTITAPIAGRTGIRQVDAGNIVHPGDTNGIVVITQVTPIDVVFSLPQQHLLAINQELAHQKKRLKVLALAPDGSTLDEGALELVDNTIDQTTGTIKLKSVFPNAKRLLWPGGFVNVRLLLRMAKDSLTVPSAAVQLGPKGAYVFVVKDDETVNLRPVKVEFTEGEVSVMAEGVEEGERIVTEGMAKLREGSKVSLPRPAETPPPAEAVPPTP